MPGQFYFFINNQMKMQGFAMPVHYDMQLSNNLKGYCRLVTVLDNTKNLNTCKQVPVGLEEEKKHNVKQEDINHSTKQCTTAWLS